MKKYSAIEKKLETGNARITGKASMGQRWPDEPHAWIVEDLDEQTTIHVPVFDRPDWEQYAPESALRD